MPTVDDEPQILRFLRPGLTAGDFDIISATTGREAIKLAAATALDVIVLALPDTRADNKYIRY